MSTEHVTLIAHTHWDREWYEPFEVFRTRLLEMLDDALDHLERDPRLSFTLDGQMALVDDYLELRPSAEPRIRALVQAGRLHIGPWFTAADTLLTDGESLIRNLSLGLRRAEHLGGAMKIGYMPDQFGHAAQLPQILRMFGIDAATVWRGVGPDRPPPAFRWVAPDGSWVTTLWLQDGYASGRRLPSEPGEFASAVERSIDRLDPWLGGSPLIVPVGDDHVRIASWLPEAAAALRERRGGLSVEVGAYHHHLARIPEPSHAVHGELRSPAFAPVLAGVASARISEKQAAARATTLLLRYAEPLSAWATLGGGAPPREMLARAWRHAIHNQAHDSAAGCGIDSTHDDVKTRWRWAEQLAVAARDQALGQLRLDAELAAFHPGPAEVALLVETDVPRSLGTSAVAVGPDGIARPLQFLDDREHPPLFEGEFSAVELAGYIGGLDPATPLFGRYLTGIAISPDGPARLRLDVGMGDAPAAPGRLAADQRTVAARMNEIERFRVVLHSTGTTRRALVSVGPAPEGGLVPIALRGGEPAPSLERASAQAGTPEAPPWIAAGPLRVTAAPDGTVLITDERIGLPPVRANDLVDEGDRGDLYHFDPIAGPAQGLRPVAARTSVIESGPLRARLRIEQDFELPVGLAKDRASRSPSTRTTTAVTEVSVVAGERRVEISTELDNEVLDHRLRALVHLPFSPERLDVEHGLAVVSRPLDTTALGAGTERAAPTGQHHGFVDVSDGRFGIALMSRGLPEHEVVRDPGGGALALTLLRGVGWLARGDLSCVDQAVGPMVPTPGGQERGPHRFEYAILPHQGGFAEGSVLSDARNYAAPPIAFVPQRAPAAPGAATEKRPAGLRTLPRGRALVEATPAEVVVTAVHPASEERGIVVRVLNASPRAVEATLRPAIGVGEIVEIDPLERPLPGRPALERAGEEVRFALAPWRLATFLLRGAR